MRALCKYGCMFLRRRFMKCTTIHFETSPNLTSSRTFANKRAGIGVPLKILLKSIHFPPLIPVSIERGTNLRESRGNARVVRRNLLTVTDSSPTCLRCLAQLYLISIRAFTGDYFHSPPNGIPSL